MTETRTAHYGLRKPDFNQSTWHGAITGNFDALDALIYETLQVAAITGVWDNATAYTVGARLVDEDTAAIYTCLVAHTSAVSGSFATARVANPTYWLASTQALSARGQWLNATVYNANDLVYDATEGVAGICIVTHTSNASDDIRDDAANWIFLIDLASGAQAADGVSYDNGTSGLTATDVQAALDELDGLVDGFTAALALKAALASPALTGTPTAPTAATETANTQIANTAYVANKIAASGAQFTNVTVRLATTANVALATALEDGDTLDGQTIATGDLILVKNQSAPAENGIYVAPASGAASRSTSYDAWAEILNLLVLVTAGTANAGKSFRSLANSGGTLGTTALEFAEFGSAGVSLPLAATEGGTGETSLTAAFASMKQDATDSATGVVEKATAAEVRSAASNKYVSADLIESASALVALSDATTVAVDWDAGINFSLTITANRVLGNPTNGQPGTVRTVLVQGDSTTDRTLTFGAQYLGDVPEITDCDSGVWYLLTIFCVTTSHFVVSAKKAKG